MTLELENTIGASRGDKVKVELEDAAIIKGAALFYLAPLIGLMAGIFIGKYIAQSSGQAHGVEIKAAVSGIIAMLVTFLGIRRYSSFSKARYKPRIRKA
jgi:sigma-E factor negative regulatory protein RseC